MKFWLGWMLGAALAAGTASAETQAVPYPRDVEAKLMKGEFADLDALADGLRKSGARVIGGEWALLTVYADLGLIREADCHCGPHGAIAFDDKRQALEKWLQANPKSLTARIALARLWSHWADVGRGGDYAQKTSAEQWKAYGERLAKAIEYIRPVDPDADPAAYLLDMDLVTAADDPHAALLSLYARATAAFPTFQNFAGTRFFFTEARWYGEPGESAAFTQTLAARADDEALMDYFEAAATALSENHDYSTLLDSSGVFYPHLVKAFAYLAGHYGARAYDKNVLLYYACAARDFKTAALLVDKIDGAFEPTFWGDKATYDGVVAWVRQWRLISRVTGD